MNLFLLYEQISLLDDNFQNKSIELLEKRSNLYSSMHDLATSAGDRTKLSSFCANFRVKMKNGDTNKKPERFSKTTGMPMNSEDPKSTEQVLNEFMNEIGKVQDIELKIQLIQGLSERIKFEFDNKNEYIDKKVAKTYTKNLKTIIQSDPELKKLIENDPDLTNLLDMDDYDGKTIGEILSYGLIIVGVIGLGVERVGKKFKSKSKKEQDEAKIKYEELSKELLKKSLEQLKLDIQKTQQENLNKQKQKLEEYNKEQHDKPLPDIKVIDRTTEYATLVRKLLYGKNDGEIADIHVSFAQAVNNIIGSNDTEVHSMNFEIMLDPSNDEILHDFLINLANLPSKSLESNLLSKLRGLTTPMISGKLEAYNPQPASYTTRETKIIQLEIALYLSEYKENHPDEDKQIPLPYKKSKKDKLGYPDIFAIPKKDSPDSKETSKVLDITWYIYAMESQKIFEEKDESGDVMNLGQIFDYLSVLPEWDLQREVVIEFAHKYRTINKLKSLDKDNNNLKHPMVPENMNYRSYLFQLINSSFLKQFLPLKADGESLNQPALQAGPETDEQLIKKYMLYLIQLSEQKEFKEKVAKLQNTINNLSNLNSNNQKEYNRVCGKKKPHHLIYILTYKLFNQSLSNPAGAGFFLS